MGGKQRIMHIGVEGGQNFLSRLSKSSSDLLVLHLSDIVILITTIHETMNICIICTCLASISYHAFAGSVKVRAT